MQFTDKSKYHIMTLTSMGLRLCPLDRQPLNTSNLWRMQATSAETNVLNVPASLGYRTKALTKFVKGAETAAFIKAELRKRNIEYEGPDEDAGGPWGYRHQINIAESGYGARGPKVLNDRAGEVGRSIKTSDFNLEKLFCEEGCNIFHLSGLIFALSESTTEACLDIARKAKEHGAKISFDVNYRESFWKGREKELRESFEEMAGMADILVGAGYLVAGGKGRAKSMDEEIEYAEALRKTYPKAEYILSTFREVKDACTHRSGAVLCEKDKLFVLEPREVAVYDRIGGGDGFLSGFLYGILKGYGGEDCLKLGWAASAMAVSVADDYATPLSENQLWNIYGGDAAVKR